MNHQNETLETIHSLRSTHGNFTEQEVSDEDFQAILAAAVRAANASARQSYSIVVVEDSALIKQLCGYVGSKGLVFCVDYTRIIDTAELLDRLSALDNDDRVALPGRGVGCAHGGGDDRPQVLVADVLRCKVAVRRVLAVDGL